MGRRREQRLCLQQPGRGLLREIGAIDTCLDGVAQVAAQGWMDLLDAVDGVSHSPLDGLSGTFDGVSSGPGTAAEAVGGGELGDDPDPLRPCAVSPLCVAEALCFSDLLL